MAPRSKELPIEMSQPTSRRFFLGAATALASSRVWGANDKINVGIIGLGGRGTNHLNIYSRLPEARVAGICDIDQAAREKANATLFKNTGEKAPEFEDMRQAFADPHIEAVSIATPNHWHALAAIWAMKAGKDVYGEKPACYNIHEGQVMLQVARDTKRMLQIGSQHRSTPFKMKAIRRHSPGTDRRHLYGEGPLLQAPRLHRPCGRQPDASRRELGSLPRARAFASLQQTPFQIQLALVLGHRQRRHRQPGRP